MKALKLVVILALVYASIVVLFETSIGILQPKAGTTLVITTFSPGGASHARVVARLEADGHLYVAANHWPRSWYRRALANPDVRAEVDGQTRDYRAVPVTGAERERVEAANPLPLAFRFVTGFPPREFLRLDPR